MKTKVKLKRAAPRIGVALLAAVILLLSQCSKDDDITPLSSSGSSGIDIINTTDGTWSFDKAHSNVRWETMYYEDNALLTGRFNNFNISIDFDEANPQNGKIEAWIQLSTFNTGESGRDAPGKCGPNYMGIQYLDTLYTVDPATDTAWFNSTSIERYGDGYLAKGNLIFKGVTKSQNMYFKYTGQKDYSDPPDGSKIKGGFSGEFTINATTDYGVTSTSIADKVTVLINANYKKN